MNIILSLIISGTAVTGIVAVAVAGYFANMHYFFGVVIPYLAIITFFVGIIYRVVKWGKSPVPFRIPSTCSQQKSLPWIKYDYVDKLDNPSTRLGVWGRMILEVFFFRSLFRNTRMQFGDGEHIRYTSSKWLWLGAMGFHICFVVVLIRHLRFVTQPLPFFVEWIENVDGFFQFWLPVPYQTGLLLGAAVTFLLLRRILIPQMRYISLPADYFPLFLILAIAKTGILMRYVVKADVVRIKEFTMGMITFNPVVTEGISVFFYIHLLLVSVLVAYFPFSKLTHMAGVFLSPTRNMENNNRAVRHINPWNPEPKFHTYEAYEDDFREAMIEAGIPVDKKSAASAE